MKTMTGKVTMPVDEAIKTIRSMLKSANLSGEPVEHVIALSMAIDALRVTACMPIPKPPELTKSDIASALLALADGDHDNGVLQMLGKTALLRIAADLIDREERENGQN